MLDGKVTVNRRKADRHALPPDSGASVSFRWPDRRGAEMTLPLRDVSKAGLSFFLGSEMPGLDIGECLRGFEVRGLGHVFRGELLVMHITPKAGATGLVGGLFYPASDDDLLRMRDLVRHLED